MSVNKMVYDVVGVNYANKGAQLMLYAIIEAIRKRSGASEVSMNLRAARHARKRKDPVRASLWLETVRPSRLDWAVRAIGNRVPSKIRDIFEFVADRDVATVLDASGFLYGDQWGVRGLRRRLYTAERWKRQGKRVILLPQAFGPFESQESRDLMGRLIQVCELVYARDNASLACLLALSPDAKNVRLAPDFTNLVAGVPPSDPDAYVGAVAIVPNQRMLDKSPASAPGAYIKLLVKAVEKLRLEGRRAFILLHEIGDYQLAQQLSAEFRGGLEIVQRDDPRELKGIIGCCDFIIASRYHAIVSALSQGVPAIGTSWSHKYEQLFEGYEISNLLVSDYRYYEETMAAALAALLDEVTCTHTKQALKRCSDHQKRLVRELWEEVLVHSKSTFASEA